ncbi:diacylglycerol kinase [Fictibacillus macauensis ZFHKF-1]|uniref:Diacylglycerol kinase n=1 Tax=Fictibacillus macauensis ZFHKF-1 TaxID=1196324 RepID=I8AHL4_9BACL|nr:diacylglycerol kinase family protein [Fictibacillus macauensis]EIT85212.1 diacylglycerol kinase [Fictibacillus macauensis ZFHKF-1]
MHKRMHRFKQSFLHAARGIKTAFQGEQNIFIHVGVGILVTLVAMFLHFSAEKMALLLLVIGGVIALEIVNTAIEHLVDLVTEEYHPLAKKVKDLASGAVLVFCAIAVIIGLLLFLHPIASLLH